MAENPKPPYRRQILDDIFDAYVILGKGTYVSLYDVVGQMTRYSPAAVDLFDLPGEYIPAGADKWSARVHPEDRLRYETIMGKLIEGTAKHYDLHYRVRIKDGSYSMLHLVGSILRNEASGLPELIGGIMINEGLMEYTDPITVLRNQYGFYQDLSAAMELEKKCTMLMIGITKIGELNEVQGYSYGNKVLQQIGWLLQERLGMEGTLYRMDGAKFLLLTEQLNEEQVANKYDEIRKELLNGIQVDQTKQVLISSGGMITINGKGVDERAVFSALSYTCRESRLHKNGRLVNFNGNLNQNAQSRLELIDEIRNSILIDRKGFKLEYQLTVDANTEEPTGLETFVKYESERFGEITEDEFIPILERDFVFEELGYWILRQAMRDGRKLLELVPEFILGVSITQVQLEDEYFIEEIQKISRQEEFPLENLCLELTRTCRLLNMEFVKIIVEKIKKLGIKIIINDFGTGLASIDFLRELEPDYIKFDKKYSIHFDDESCRQIIRCLSELAGAFGTKVCINGIDNEYMHQAIKGYKVHRLQGSFYAPLMPLPQIIEQFFKT